MTDRALDREGWSRQGLLLIGVTIAYFLAGKLGLALAFVNASATPVWPPTGIAIAVVLLFGRRLWPAILLGAFLVNITTTGFAWPSFGIAVGNTLEALLGAALVSRYAGGARAFDHARNVFRFAALAAGVSTAVCATIGTASLALAGLARGPALGSIWFTWWLGDAGGDLLVAPLILLWAPEPTRRGALLDLPRTVALMALAGVTAWTVFGGILPASTANYPLQFLCTPILIWAAFRWGPKGAVVATAAVYIVAVQGTLRGLGPFAVGATNESLLLLQAYTCVTCLTTMGLAAVVAERERGLHRLQHLAVSDPMTELANYRSLMDVLEREVHRSGRTQRPFALLFIDVNGLKQLNDEYGHMIGTRALCRVAERLRQSCRAVDTPARYGGDEFAVVLPETGREPAGEMARRLAASIASDGEAPPISVSTGVAVFPEDGTTVGDLLAAADRAQYGTKRRHRASPPPTPPAGVAARSAH